MVKMSVFQIKTGSAGRTRLFFHVLNHPWDTVQCITELGEAYGKLEEELVSLRLKLAEEMSTNTCLRQENFNLKKEKTEC
jgi:hypothetical protein